MDFSTIWKDLLQYHEQRICFCLKYAIISTLLVFAMHCLDVSQLKAEWLLDNHVAVQETKLIFKKKKCENVSVERCRTQTFI